MSFKEVFEEWARSWKQRNIADLTTRFEKFFGSWPTWKLKKLFDEADMEFERFPTPNKLKQLAMERGLYEAKEAHTPRGCPLCNYTGFVPVETPAGYELAATCMCEKGKFLQRLSETTSLDDGKIYPRTPVQKLMKREGYKPLWAATCEGCTHYEDGICKLTGEEKPGDSMACTEYAEERIERDIAQVTNIQTIPDPQEMEDDEYPF